jgi:hypothetical protein
MSVERESNWNDEDLVLFYYGEHPAPAALERSLAADSALRARLERLRLVLAVAAQVGGGVPEPDADFESRLWRRLSGRLASNPRSVRTVPPQALRWALAAGLFGLLAGAFYLGRNTSADPADAPPAAVAEAISAEGQDRILRAAVARHLERVERLFVDLDHGRVVAASDSADGGEPPQRELLQDNRLYRSALQGQDHERLVRFLDEIEPLLAELAHASNEDLRSSALRERLRERDFLFKLRVVSRRLRGEVEHPAPPRPLL